VPQDEVWVVERFGKFSRVCGNGFHFILPIVDKVKAVKPAVPLTMGVMTKDISSKCKALLLKENNPLSSVLVY
jgi:regulator of protease activity HflC (stomatin/prohibitin superfamily)